MRGEELVAALAAKGETSALRRTPSDAAVEFAEKFSPREDREGLLYSLALLLDDFARYHGVVAVRHVSLDEWQAEGVAKFGEDSSKWKFRCPSCGRAQGLTDFTALGMKPEVAQRFLGYSCVGVWNASLPDARVVEFLENDQGHGCKYAGDGPVNLSPVMLHLGKMQIRPTFEWAEAPSA